mmetsp:Transcript_126895/g.364981  ORF Transcript_126895/g.364981 Transcript_126895/m.364981 type:complete len:161 (+) Transcript_126895:229-711(+)
MFGRVAQEYANTGPVKPFVVRLLGLKGSLKDVDWGAKRMEVTEIRFDFGTRHLGDGRAFEASGEGVATNLLFRGEVGRKRVPEISVVFEGSWPQGGMYGRGPAVCSMEEGGAGTLGDVLDAAFGLAILVVGVGATESEGLPSTFNRRFKELSLEMIVFGN